MHRLGRVCIIMMWSLKASAALGQANHPAVDTNAPLSQTRPAEPTTAPAATAPSEEEPLARLERTIQENEKQLKESRAKLDDPRSEYAGAKDEFKQIDDQLERDRRLLEEAEKSGRTEDVESLKARIDDLEKQRMVAQDRFDLAVQERKAIQEQATHLEQKLQQDKAELDGLLAQAASRQIRNPFAPRNLLQWTINNGPKVLGIILAVFALLWLTNFMTQRITSLIARRAEHGSMIEREQRAKTLAEVFRSTAHTVIVAGGVIMILDVLGVPVAPLLGGAAVVGLAVAFGAQNLIRDYFTGFVILVENQYAVNDVVKIADIGGLVERITLRVTVLRDLEGVAHFIPNGQITTVSNMTHLWSRALFDIGVAYKEDVDQVMEVLLELSREARQDPKLGPLILADAEMLGVDEFGDSAVVIKFFIKTRPIQQWTVKREMLRRIKKRFDELGIEIPFPHRTVYHRMEGPSGPESLPGLSPET